MQSNRVFRIKARSKKVFPFIYERFRAVDLSTDLRNGIDIYRDLNSRLLEDIGCLHHVFKESAETPMADNLKFWSLAFLFVDPNQTAIEFKRRYKNVFNHVLA